MNLLLNELSPQLNDSLQAVVCEYTPSLIFLLSYLNIVLSKVKDFLPKMAEANKKLQEDINNNQDVSIEKVDKSKPYIKMVCPFNWYYDHLHFKYSP